jgi:hypothetical protein
MQIDNIQDTIILYIILQFRIVDESSPTPSETVVKALLGLVQGAS